MRMMPRADRPGAHRQPAGLDSGIPQGNRIRRLKLLWQVEVAQRFPIHADVPPGETVNAHPRPTRRPCASNPKFSAAPATSFLPPASIPGPFPLGVAPDHTVIATR